MAETVVSGDGLYVIADLAAQALRRAERQRVVEALRPWLFHANSCGTISFSHWRDSDAEICQCGLGATLAKISQ